MLTRATRSRPLGLRVRLPSLASSLSENPLPLLRPRYVRAPKGQASGPVLNDPFGFSTPIGNLFQGLLITS